MLPLSPQLKTNPDPWDTQIYWVGPILGSLLASAFYRFMKMLEYETANPGADFDELEREHFNPEIHVSRPPTIINLQPNDQHDIERHGEPRTVAGAEADHYGPDGAKASPGTHPAGKGRHRRLSALKGGRKEPGSSPAGPAQKETDVYDAVPGAKMGHESDGAKT